MLKIWFAIFTMLLISCSDVNNPSPIDTILGRWRNNHDTLVISDNEITSSSKTSQILNGNYTILSQNYIRIYSSNNFSKLYLYEHRKDSLRFYMCTNSYYSNNHEGITGNWFSNEGYSIIIYSNDTIEIKSDSLWISLTYKIQNDSIYLFSKMKVYPNMLIYYLENDSLHLNNIDSSAILYTR